MQVFLRCEVSDFSGKRCGNVAVWHHPITRRTTCNQHRPEGSYPIGQAPRATKAETLDAVRDAVNASDESSEEKHKA